MLKLDKVCVAYGDVQVLYDISLHVKKGEIVSLVGANGAGKTTTLKTISGLLRPFAGSISFMGEQIEKMIPSRIVEMGLAHIPEGRQLFSNLTVLENLEMGAYLPRAKAKRKETLQIIYKMYPRLKERFSQTAKTLSGGEQQMLAIARGLMSLPQFLILDEPSLGLAPLAVKEIFDTIRDLNRQGTTVLLVEQNLVQPLKISNKAYVIETGKIILSGTSEHLLKDERTKKAYLGL